jgi:cytochrome P450
MALPAVSPLPPIAEGVGMPWDVAVEDPVLALAAAREQYGDTFVVDSSRDRYLFTFSPVGVASFYALAEQSASKGLADFRMLSRKLPEEIFAGRRTFPHELFNRDDRLAQLAGLSQALDATVQELGESGTLDLFALTRRIGHRVGLASWGGPGSASGANFDRLVAAFDALDGAEAFVRPDVMAAVAANGKADEKAALAEVALVIGEALDQPLDPQQHPLFARVVDRWADEPTPVRRTGVAYDVALVHIASMSNLFAALGWTLVDLMNHPPDRDRVAGGDTARAEQCAIESTRLAQRSIMARYVLQPLRFDSGEAVHDVEVGTTIATLLPLTNSSSAPGLDHWDPDRWDRWRLVGSDALAAPELVTAFGHGRHTCPAQPFSLAAMTAISRRLFTEFDIAKIDDVIPVPEPAQIGGVARVKDPVLVSYQRRL